MATKNDKETTKPASDTAGINPAEDVVLIGTGKSKHLAKGEKYTAKGVDAIALIEAGKATLTTDK